MTAPDQVLISGVLQSGVVASIRLKAGITNGRGVLFKIQGTEGTLAIVPADSSQEPPSYCARRAGRQTAGGSLNTGALSLGSTGGPGGASFQRCAAVHADG
jgi:hypothetical protein